MHVADSQQYFADIEHGDVVAETTIFAQSVEKLPSGAILEDHVHKHLVLECRLQRVDEGVVQLCQDAFLKLDVIHLLQVYYVRFRDLLEG